MKGFLTILLLQVSILGFPAMLAADDDPCQAKKAWEDSQKLHFRNNWTLPSLEASAYEEQLKQARESTDPELQKEIPRLEAALAYLRLETEYLKAKNETLPRALEKATKAAQAVKDDSGDAKQRLRSLKASVTKTLGCFSEGQALIADLNKRIAAVEAKEKEKIAEMDENPDAALGDDKGGKGQSTEDQGLGNDVDLDNVDFGEGEEEEIEEETPDEQPEWPEWPDEDEVVQGAGGGAPCAGWTGQWDTSYGKMSLGAGSGSYDYFGNAEHAGTISAKKVEGNVLEGDWKQADGKHGTFQFDMDPGTGNFSGSWAYHNNSDGGGWSGKCLGN